MFFNDAAMALGGAFAGLQAGAKARGTEQTAAHARMLDQFIGVTVLNHTGVYMPSYGVAAPVKPCRYCGVDDFKHHQCQRCGAPR